MSYHHVDYPHCYSIVYVSRCGVSNHVDRVSVGVKLFGGLDPRWDAVNLAHHIDNLALELENLIAATTNGFQALLVEVKALCNVALQNRLVLDQLLAAQGAVCHIIVDTCCTYVPDISDNMTHVVSYLNLLLQTQHNRNSAESWGLDM